MGLLDKLGKPKDAQKIVSANNSTGNYVNVEADKQLDLTKEEYEFLFAIIKNSTFRGTELEIIYSILGKLQTKYLDKVSKSETNK